MRFKVAVRGRESAGEGKASLPRSGDGKPQSPRGAKKCTQAPALPEMVRVHLQKHACQTATGQSCGGRSVGVVVVYVNHLLSGHLRRRIAPTGDEQAG